jgi:hypothetical protein
MTARLAFDRIKQSAIASLVTATAFLSGCSLTGADLGSNLLSLNDRDDRGDISIAYGPVEEDNRLKALKHILETSGTYEAIAQDLNGALSLPEDVQIEFLQCNSEDAYYDPNSQRITLCYELIQRYTEALGSQDGSMETAALHAGLFTLFHELGHALIDLMELPVTGREEDAADEFAAVMLLWSNQEQAALSGAQQFSVDAEEWEAVPFWDEHGTDMQRYYNIACYVYGSDVERWQSLVSDESLPQERADVCEEDYWRKSNSWNKLLAPYLKRQIELTALNEQMTRNSQRGL